MWDKRPGCQHRDCCFRGWRLLTLGITARSRMMSQYNRAISTQQSTEASSCRIYTDYLNVYIHILGIHKLQLNVLYCTNAKWTHALSLRPSDLFTEKQGNLKQMFVFTSRCSLGVLATDHSPAVISLLTSPHNPQHISALPTPMESRVGFCFRGF